MNTFLYPVKDTYITSDDATKNFGIDEILELRTKNNGEKVKLQPNSYWVEIPESPSSIGKKGQVAYDEVNNGFYCYVLTTSSAGWKYYSLPEGIAEYGTHFVNFSGDLYSTSSYSTYIEGKVDYIEGWFTGSIKTDTMVSLDGYCTTGSFTGTIYSGAEFETLIVNDITYTSPLTEDVSGSGYFEKFTGSLEAIFASGRGNPCFGEGYFCGKIEAQNFSGIIDAYIDESSFSVTNTDLYTQGGYNGEINSVGLPEKVIDAPKMSRMLLYFNLDEVFDAINVEDIKDPQYNLRFIACTQKNIPFN